MWVSGSSFHYHKHSVIVTFTDMFSDMYLPSSISHALILILLLDSGPVTVVGQGIMVIVAIIISAMKMLSTGGVKALQGMASLIY
jgi:hypothetical protein